MLRALLMGSVFAALVPGVPMPLATLRAELFKRYRLDWKLGVPPDAEAPGGTYGADLSRFFSPEDREADAAGRAGRVGQPPQPK
jgi:hypothetical protein